MTEPEVAIHQRRAAAEWEALGLRCPACRGLLCDGDATSGGADTSLDGAPSQGAQAEVGPAKSGHAGGARDVHSLACTSCHRVYPVRCGIPDLRLGGDPYLTVEEDHRAAERLDAMAGSCDFGALYSVYYEGNEKVSPAQVAQFTRGVLAAPARAGATLAVWRQLGPPLAPGAVVVDLGCGTAPLGLVLAALGHPVIAIDAGLRWLVLARRRAAEHNIDLPVVCANAEHLPLRDGVAMCVAGESVLEHLPDPRRAMAEAWRVLRPGGALWLTAANRRSLGPDPHLGVLAGGWWPDALLRAHAARSGQVFPRRTLFTPASLSHLVREAGFRKLALALPVFVDEQRAGLPVAVNAAVDAYHVVRRIPLLRAVVLRVAPTIVCSALRS